MKKEVYEEIIGSLEARRKLCFEHLGAVHTTDDLKELSLAKAAELKRFCIEESDIMTKIVMVDLYHIIGMGNLSPTQMMEFTYKIKDYLSYRPRIKVLAQHLNTIEGLPTLPVTTKFKLLGLGDAPPTFIWHTAQDKGVPVIGSLLLAAKLCENGVATCLHVYPYGGHGLSLSNRITDSGEGKQIVAEPQTWVRESFDFISSLK